jgi:hypothetical protein
MKVWLAEVTRDREAEPSVAGHDARQITTEATDDELTHQVVAE